jgi:hypothetical protein
MKRITSRWRGLLAGAGVLAVTIIFGTQWAWPWYVELSLGRLGWENGDKPGSAVFNPGGAAYSSRSAVYRGGQQIHYTWPLRYKPEWKEVYARAGLTSRDAKDLSRAGQIEKLHVDGRILPGTLAPLVRLPRLLHLSIITDVRGEDLRDLRDSQSLESIYVDSSDGQGMDFYAALAEIKTLRRVVIGSSVTAEELEPLSRLPNLRFLIVPGLRPSPGLARVFQGMPQLQQVGLGGGNVYPDLAPELRHACPKLKVLPDDGGPLSDSNYDETVFEQQGDPPVLPD